MDHIYKSPYEGVGYGRVSIFYYMLVFGFSVSVMVVESSGG